MALLGGALGGLHSHARKRAPSDYGALWLGAQGFGFKTLNPGGRNTFGPVGYSRITSDHTKSIK